MQSNCSPESVLLAGQIDSARLSKIYSYGNVKSYIIDFRPDIIFPDIPHVLFFKTINDFHGFKRTGGVNNQSYLVKISSFHDLKLVENSHVPIDLLIDVDIDASRSQLNNLKLPNVEKIFLHLNENSRGGRLCRFIEKTQNLSFSNKIQLQSIDLFTNEFSDWPALEDYERPPIFSQGKDAQFDLSIIVPHYNSPHFVCAALRNISKINSDNNNFEVILVDDHSHDDQLAKIVLFIKTQLPDLNIKILQWPNVLYGSSGKRLFRAGASRNWGAHIAESDTLFFLDADMLVPNNLVQEINKTLNSADVVQFVRLHIPRNLSRESSLYDGLINNPDLFIEESDYWGRFFSSDNWMNLVDYWKYCCTYGLALKKKSFLKVGRIRRNFISYGFEDTDLGFRLANAGFKFSLNKAPLLHLTNSETSLPDWYFRLVKRNRIKPMARVFFKLNPLPELYKKWSSLVD